MNGEYSWTSQGMAIVDKAGKQVACTFSWVGSVEKAEAMAAYIAAAPDRIADLEAQVKALRIDFSNYRSHVHVALMHTENNPSDCNVFNCGMVSAALAASEEDSHDTEDVATEDIYDGYSTTELPDSLKSRREPGFY